MEIEQVTQKDEILAVIVRKDYTGGGVHFFTPADFSQQLGYMQHPAGMGIQPHVHRPVQREVKYTQEVLFIRKGRIRVDFYSRAHEYLESKILGAGDVILLAGSGHGFKVLEDVEMFEVKQGPYAEDEDKVRFEGVADGEVILKGSTE